jgi:hypothetical protein
MHAAPAPAVRISSARVRGILTGAALFLATAAFTFWQNTRVAVLWDLSYLMDSSWRFSLGQLPYRDLPFAHAPLTFLLHAAMIRVFGRIYYPHIVCAALEAGAATLLTWRILLRLLASFAERAWWIATLLASTLVPLGIYSIYPHPIYDSDCVLAVLAALYLLQRSMDGSRRAASIGAGIETGGNVLGALAGAACVLPLFFKQNIGLPFLAAALLAVAAAAFARHIQRATGAPPLSFFAGAFIALIAAAGILQTTVGLLNYRYWTITFAAQRRLPGLGDVLNIYHQTSLLWTIPAAAAGVFLLRNAATRHKRWARLSGFALLAAPFLWTMAALTLLNDADDRADQLLSLWPHLLVLAAALAVANLRPRVWRAGPAFSALLPLLLLATIHGAFLSQQLWGSTYAIWPLLLLLIALMLAEVRSIAQPLAAVITAAFLLCGSFYGASHERLDYIHLDGAEAHATLPSLRGLATPGPWIPEFEELVRFTDAEIPAGDGILLIPGEDPFYFATGRVPQFPILLFDPATDPYTPRQTLEEARSHDIRWLIVKRHLQLTAPPQPDLPEVLHLLQQDFVPYRSLTGYDMYRRR